MANSTPDTSEIRRKGRQRLIGAVALVLLLVVFVPMLLDPEPRREKEAALAIPPKEGAPALPTPALSRPADAAKPAEAAKPEAPAPVPAKPVLADTTKSSVPPRAAEPPKVDLAKVIEAKTAPAKKAEPAKPEAAKPAEPVPKLEGFAVQVGAFREEDKLRQAREKLSAARITHFIERLPAGELTRLRAGPYRTREEADKALAAVKAAGLDGKVVPLP